MLKIIHKKGNTIKVVESRPVPTVLKVFNNLDFEYIVIFWSESVTKFLKYSVEW